MKQLITKVSEVIDVLTMMEKAGSATSDVADLQFVSARIANVRKKILANTLYSSWPLFFLRIGNLMLRIATVHNVNINKTEFSEFLLAKHKAYGAEPFADWKEVGILMRLGSKIARLINLEEDPDLDINCESFQDTLKDIIGYCVLGYYMDRL